MQAQHQTDPYSIAKDQESSMDNWFGVEDARTRKQIQDRLAQRARRENFGAQKYVLRLANVIK